MVSGGLKSDVNGYGRRQRSRNRSWLLDIMTSTFTTKVMAHIKGVEHMPQDALREIMIRVAGQSEGAANIARAFSVSKTFRNFAKDGDVLRSVSFKDSVPCLAEKYELLSEVGGLVDRCSRAGNLNAQFILSKVVLVSASLLCNAKMEASQSDESLYKCRTLSTGNHNLSSLDKAARLLYHLSVQNTDHAKLIDLVRNFLSEAKVGELIEMNRQLKDFVALYLVPGRKPHHEQFLATLDKLRWNATFPLGFTTDPLSFIVMTFNVLCNKGDKMMKDMRIDEEVFRPLLQCLVKMNDNVGCDTLMERLDIVEPILKLGGQVASTQGNHEEIMKGVSSITDLRVLLMMLIDHEAFVQSARELLSASFNALFDT